MYNVEIPKNIELKIYEMKAKRESGVSLEQQEAKVEYCVLLKNERNLIWFTVSEISYNISERLLNSDRKSINLIKKSMSRLNFGHKRRLLLNGVGFKADVISGVDGMPVLTLKIGKPEGANYEVPKDVTVRVSQNVVEV